MYEVLLLILIFLVTLLGVYFWQKHNYWKSRDVPTPFVFPILGHLHTTMFGYRWEKIDQMYYKYKSKGYWGLYELAKPILYVTDLKLIKDIMVKDADSFIDRRTVELSGKEVHFNEMLTAVTGQKWKSLRALMSPTFTTGKIKAMMPLIAEKGEVFLQECEHEMKKNGFVEVKSLLSYYTLDTIASCAFGVDAKCLKDKSESEFVKVTSSVFNFNWVGVLKFILISCAPRLARLSGVSLFGDVNFLCDMVRKNCEFRKETNTRRGDFLDILLDALKEQELNTDPNKYPMTMNTIVAESILFIFAGFDTTGNALAITVYLLAHHKEVQKKLRKELQTIVEADGELTYQNVMESHYLDACISESLRIYPPAHFLERNCTKAYKIPDTAVEIPENMVIGIPAWSIHRDPEFWEDPLTFNPDRFMPENKGNIIPYSYLPFGLGPRNCIGMRFAQLEVKLVLAQLCLKFDFDLRPGYNGLKLAKVLNTLRPDDTGVQLTMRSME